MGAVPPGRDHGACALTLPCRDVKDLLVKGGIEADQVTVGGPDAHADADSSGSTVSVRNR